MAAEGSDEWVKIMADDFTATVSKRILLAQADSHLAQVISPSPSTNLHETLPRCGAHWLLYHTFCYFLD